MVKFPSQNKIMYAGATISNGNFAATHTVCLPKDFAIMNRRGYDCTTRKGVPLVYKVLVTQYPADLDGSGYVADHDSDVRTTTKFLGVQNNWAIRNAAVKWHAAREKNFGLAGIKKKDRGAYSHTIRYGWTGASESWAAPVDGAGAAFTGGTWDLTDLSYAADASFKLCLTGNGDDEETDSFSGSVLSLGHSYLVSRVNQLADTNPEAEEGPAQYSVLNKMLSGFQESVSIQDDIIDNARNEQDNPPYEVLDLSDSGDVSHDITEPAELGRLTMTPLTTSSPQSVVLDVPFGIMQVQSSHQDPGNNSGVTDGLCFGVELLSIYEMQG